MKFFKYLLLISVLVFASCEKDDNTVGPTNPFDLTTGGVIILNEGQFGEGNASISYYSVSGDSTINNIYRKANGDTPLGDIATSISFYKNKGFITMSASSKILIIDPKTSKNIGKITEINSPRYMTFISDTKAYVSSLNLNQIHIINPQTEAVTGSIQLEAGNSAEMLIEHNGYVYANCWNNNSKMILKIDTKTDKVVASLEVGYQPNCMVMDKNNDLWITTDGGWNDAYTEHLENPKLTRVSTTDFSIKASYNFGTWDYPNHMTINKTKDKIYFINTDVYEMPITGSLETAKAIVKSEGKTIYALGIAPTGELYMSDAIDYQQDGMIYKYTPQFTLAKSFKAGVNPASFWFN